MLPLKPIKVADPEGRKYYTPFERLTSRMVMEIVIFIQPLAVFGGFTVAGVFLSIAAVFAAFAIIK
jgi:hypothetical protein